MRLNYMIILFVITVLGNVLSEHVRTKRLMYAMCPPGFVGIGSLCYYISDYQVSWLDAQFECKDKNSKLAEPIKLADKKLRRYLQEYDKERNDIWIGGTFDWHNEKWTWGYSGKDMTYNSFGPLELGNKQDIPYHCAVLDPTAKYRWSARSCVDQHRFVCQHKMPRVSEKNRAKIYNRWNQTYPNQYANEIVLELTEDNYRRVSRIVKGPGSAYYSVDCKIRRLNPSDGQRRRRMRPYHIDTISSTESYPISKNFNNDINFDYKTKIIDDPVTEYVKNSNNIVNNEINTNRDVFNYEVRQYHRKRRPKTTEQPSNDINETVQAEKPQKTKFDLEIEERRRRAREKRRQERKRQRQLLKEQKQRESEEQEKIKAEREAEQKRIQEEIERKKLAQIEELESLRRQQVAEQEREQRQNDIDQKRIQEIEEQKRVVEENLRKQEEIKQRQIEEDRKRLQREHEQQLENKRQQHEEWRHSLDEHEKEEKEKLAELEKQKLLKQQEEEYRRVREEQEAEEQRRLEEERNRLEKERKLREERQKAREEEIRKREELLKREEEEEKRIQEEIRRQEEEERRAREEEERKKEEEKRIRQEEELRKTVEREEKQRQRKLKKIKFEEQDVEKEQEISADEKKRRRKAFRERLAKLSPEEQHLFFKEREERNKRKRLANKGENEVYEK